MKKHTIVENTEALSINRLVNKIISVRRSAGTPRRVMGMH